MSDTLSSMEKIRVVAIDPSVNRCGYASAVFEPKPGFRFPSLDPKGDVVDAVIPATWNEETSKWSWGYFDLSCLGYIARLHEICQFITLIYPEGFDLFVAEWPAFYDVERGHAAAIRGDTINLAGINCFVAGYYRIPPNHITFLTAAKWKGSVSKEITRMRFYKSFGIRKHYSIDHNAVDAGMMLLTWCQRTQLVSHLFPTFPKEIEQDKMHSFKG